MKLLIRCKVAFHRRKKLLDLFQKVDKYDEKLESLNELIKEVTSSSSLDVDIQAGEIELAKEDLARIRQCNEEVRECAKKVLKIVLEVQKKEEAT